MEGAYYAVGVEVPPRHGSTFSMRYTSVQSARIGRQILRRKMLKKRVGMIGELVIARAHHTESISLGGFIRRPNGRLEEFDGDINRGSLSAFRAGRG